MCTAISVWGDSVGRGILWNDTFGRYTVFRNNCIRVLGEFLSVPVYNHTRMGCTARQCLDEIRGEDLIPGARAVFEFGGNDCDMPWKDISKDPAGTFLPKVPLHEYALAMTELIRIARAHDMRPVVVIPLPIDGEKYFAWVTRGMTESERANVLAFLGDPHQMYRWQEQYAMQAFRVAYQTGADIFDLRSAFLKNIDYKACFCKDGIHPSESGYLYLGEYLRGNIDAERLCA